MKHLLCPDKECNGRLAQIVTKPTKTIYICPRCKEFWSMQKDKWVKIIDEQQLDDVVGQARKLANS